MARLTTFIRPTGGETVGVVVDEQVVELGSLVGDELARAGSRPAGRSSVRMRDVLAAPNLAELVATATSYASGDGSSDLGPVAHFPINDVQVRAPVPDPHKIIGVGLNYVSHADEADREIPAFPMLFAKLGNTVAGPYDPITIPRVTHRIDYEGELAVVIGNGGRYIPDHEALAHVAGYMVANDVSARDYQFRTKEMLSGKTFDGFAPTGPFLVTPDEVGELETLRLTTHVNGELRQSATLGEMVFSVPRLIAYISDIVTLVPGDLILTGTPSGIGATMDPRRWLRPGDEVVIEIERVGAIRNAVQAEAAP